MNNYVINYRLKCSKLYRWKYSNLWLN